MTLRYGNKDSNIGKRNETALCLDIELDIHRGLGFWHNENYLLLVCVANIKDKRYWPKLN